MHARAVRDKGGEVLRYEGAIQDVTARKEAEQSLRTSQLQLSQAMDLADIVYWEGDPASKEGAFNDPFYALFATTAEREGGYRMMMDDYAARFVHPGDLEFFHRSVGEAIADSSGVDSVRLEHRGVRRDGRIIHVVTKVKSIRDVSGRAIRFYGVTQDITARREAKEALRQSEEKYRGIFENAVEGIFQSTPDFKSVDVNPALARMRGYNTPGELEEAVAAGRDEIFLSREDKAHYACLLNKHGMLKGFETELRRKDGSTFLASVNTQAVKDAEGNVVCYEGIIEDITERRKLEGQLRQTQKMEAIGTLSAGIAHDFNNMLAIVMGSAELAMDDVANGDNPEHSLDQILKAAKRGRDLVKQILTFSRKTQRERRPTDVVPVLQETFKLLRSTLPSTVKMSLDVQSKSGVILGDSVQVEQVLMNLATNAAHAMSKAGGTLAIRLADAAFRLTDSLPEPDMKLGDYLMLIFEDTGTGMTEAVRDRIFDPFFTTKKSGQGTGMGLSVVYGIVKSYSGAITVESAPGKGSTFTIYLPKAESRTDKEKDAAQVVQGNNERVLFVDDEPALAEIAASMLERLSYRVTAVTDGKEALSLFLENPYAFDLVITDQTMPDITGIALAREMIRIRPDVPVMLCTGYGEMVSPEKAKKAGMREFLTKPLVKAELAQAIRRALEEGDGGK